MLKHAAIIALFCFSVSVVLLMTDTRISFIYYPSTPPLFLPPFSRYISRFFFSFIMRSRCMSRSLLTVSSQVLWLSMRASLLTGSIRESDRTGHFLVHILIINWFHLSPLPSLEPLAAIYGPLRTRQTLLSPLSLAAPPKGNGSSCLSVCHVVR